MKKLFLSALLLGVISMVSAQTPFRKTEFSVFTGVAQNSLMFSALGNTLGVGVQYNFSPKWGIHAAWSASNAYNVFAQRYNKKRTYYYTVNHIDLLFSPFKSKKWQFAAGFSHQYVPELSFIGVYPSDCGVGLTPTYFIEQAQIKTRLENASMNMIGYNCSVTRKIRVTKTNDLQIRLETHQFRPKQDLYWWANSTAVTALNIGFSF